MADKKTVEVKITADTRNFETGINKATSKLRNFGASVKGSVKAVGLFSVAVAGATTAAFAMANSVAKAGDDFQKMSLRTGISAENLSRLDFAAKRSGTNITVLESALRYLTKAMADTKNGTGMAKEGFDALGISVTDSHGNLKSSIDVLQEVSEKLAKMTNETEKISTAQYIFGARFGTQLLPLLTSGKEGIAELMKKSDELGYTWSTTDANAAAAFRDRLTDLQSAFDGFKRRLLVHTFPFWDGLMSGATSFIVALENTTGKTDQFFSAETKAGIMGIALFEGLANTIEDVKYSYERVKLAIENAPITVKLKLKTWTDQVKKEFGNLKGLVRRESENTFSGKGGFAGGGGGSSSAEGDLSEKYKQYQDKLKDLDESHKKHLKDIDDTFNKTLQDFLQLSSKFPSVQSGLDSLGNSAEKMETALDKSVSDVEKLKWHPFNIEGIGSNQLLSFIGSLRAQTTVKHVVELQLKWDGRKIQVSDVNNKRLVEEVGRLVLQQIQNGRIAAFGVGG